MDDLALAALREFVRTPARDDEAHLGRKQAEAAKKDAPSASAEELSRVFVTIAANLQVMADVCGELEAREARKVVSGLVGVFLRTAAILAEEAGLISGPPSDIHPRNTSEFFKLMGLDEDNLQGSLAGQLERMGLPADLFGDMTDDEIRASAAKAMGYLQ